MASSSGQVLPRNKLTTWDRVKMVLVMLPLPIILSWTLLKSPFSPYERFKSWKRVILDRMLLWIVSHLNRRQARAFFGDTRDIYDSFMTAKNLEPVVEELGEDARLLWLGPNKTERVILYFHGGAFVFGAVGSAPKLWSYMQESLKKRGKPTGVAFLNYSLIPDATFPTQLKQSVLAIRHLINSGVKPENIQLVGDSAGGVMIHEVLSHMLHPVPGVPKLILSAPLAGIYMMSPWTTMLDDEALHTNEGNGDMLDTATGLYWASKVLEGVPPFAIPYIEANSAPEHWLEGVDKLVKRILISGGGAEVLRDAIIKYSKTVEKHHTNATFFLDDYGIHDDPFFSFLVGDKDLGKLTPFVVDWLEEGFSDTPLLWAKCGTKVIPPPGYLPESCM